MIDTHFSCDHLVKLYRPPNQFIIESTDFSPVFGTNGVASRLVVVLMLRRKCRRIIFLFVDELNSYTAAIFSENEVRSPRFSVLCNPLKKTS